MARAPAAAAASSALWPAAVGQLSLALRTALCNFDVRKLAVAKVAYHTFLHTYFLLITARAARGLRLRVMPVAAKATTARGLLLLFTVLCRPAVTQRPPSAAAVAVDLSGCPAGGPV